MALSPSPYQQPRNNSVGLSIALVLVAAVLLIGGIVSPLIFRAPILWHTNTAHPSTGQDPAVWAVTLTCDVGICDLTGQLSDNTGQSMHISQIGARSWTVMRPYNTNNWLVDWQISLKSTGVLSIALNTGYSLLYVQGPTSNMGSWSTSSGQH